MFTPTTFDHDGATYTVDHDLRTRCVARLTCAEGDRTLWTQELEVMPDDHWLIFHHEWHVRDGELFLTTLGIHARGDTIRGRRHHRLDRRGITPVESLSPFQE